ncbi:leucine-rich repeat domain-containing protein [Eisenibacter elegans]
MSLWNNKIQDIAVLERLTQLQSLDLNNIIS